ncbi:MAG: HAD hydrolase family protein, partial [Desulfuromonadales bacterium]
YLELLQSLQVTDAEVGYMGDDLVDLPVLRRVGFSATVADAVEEVKPHVHYVTARPGGRGAVREVCDLILKGSDKWPLVTARYFGGE